MTDRRRDPSDIIFEPGATIIIRFDNTPNPDAVA
jgi:hypothetical protein